MDQYQEYIHKSRYARYLDEEQRREDWEETVNSLRLFPLLSVSRSLTQRLKNSTTPLAARRLCPLCAV